MQGQGGRGRMGGRGGYQQYRQGYQPYAAGWQTYHAPGGYAQQHPMPFTPVYGGRGGGGMGRGILPLGVQGAGILKKPVGPPQGPLLHGRGHQRGPRRGRGGRGGRGNRDKERDQKPLTKEALDADLDEWRMKDKKLGGQSLDADLDDYWKNKEDELAKQDDGELIESTSPADVPEASKPDDSKGAKAPSKKSNGSRPLDRNGASDKVLESLKAGDAKA